MDDRTPLTPDQVQRLKGPLKAIQEILEPGANADLHDVVSRLNVGEAAGRVGINQSTGQTYHTPEVDSASGRSSPEVLARTMLRNNLGDLLHQLDRNELPNAGEVGRVAGQAVATLGFSSEHDGALLTLVSALKKEGIRIPHAESMARYLPPALGAALEGSNAPEPQLSDTIIIRSGDKPLSGPLR